MLRWLTWLITAGFFQRESKGSSCRFRWLRLDLSGLKWLAWLPLRQRILKKSYPRQSMRFRSESSFSMLDLCLLWCRFIRGSRLRFPKVRSCKCLKTSELQQQQALSILSFWRQLHRHATVQFSVRDGWCFHWRIREVPNLKKRWELFQEDKCRQMRSSFRLW